LTGAGRCKDPGTIPYVRGVSGPGERIGRI